MNKFMKLFIATLLVVGFAFSQSPKKYWIGNEPSSDVTASEAQAIAEVADAFDGISTPEADALYVIAGGGALTVTDLEADGITISDGLTTVGAILNLSTDEPTVVDGDVLGQIDFQAPLETGADAILVSASIWAEADAEFNATVNTTSLVFGIGTSEVAVEKMRLDANGLTVVASVIAVDADFSGDLYLNTTKKLVFADDADDHTYILESGTDVLDTYVGGVLAQKITESTTISGVLYDVWDVTGAFTANSMVSDAGVSGTVITGTAEALFTNNAAAVTFGAVGTDADVVLAFDAVTAQGSITYMEDEDRFDFDNDVNAAGRVTANELRVINATSTDVSALPIYVSETLSGNFGDTGPAYGMTVYSKLLGANLTASDAYESAITGLYGITGTNASTYPKAGVLGWIMDNTTTADGAFIALIDGDTQITQAGAAYGVRHLNSTPNSGFNYGLDLYGAAIGGYDAVSYRTADIRLSDATELDVSITNGSTLETPTNVTVVNYVGAINQTVITLVSHVMTITDAAAAGAHGSLKLITFPEGHIRIMSAHQVLTTLAGAGGIDNDAILDVGVGSITTDTANDELASTEQEITGKEDATLSSGTLLFDTINATPQTLDGSASAEDAWLNVAVKEDDVGSSDTLIITGTITINWMFMGDD